MKVPTASKTRGSSSAKKALSSRLSARLANFKLSDRVIGNLADRVLIDGLNIARFDVCIYGICFDYFTDKRPDLGGILSKPDIARIEIFPYGIIDFDRFHVRVGFQVNELEGMNRGLPAPGR